MYKNINKEKNFYKNIEINGINFSIYIIFRKKRGISYYVREKSIYIYSSKYYSHDDVLRIVLGNSDSIIATYNKNNNRIDKNTYKTVLNRDEYLILGSFKKVDGRFIPYKDYFMNYEYILRDIYSNTMNKMDKSDVKLIIKPLKSKWGSYNARTNTITLNLYLLFFDKSLIESVIYHEICHIGNLSHNKIFHKDLDILCPENKVFRKKINNLTPLVKKLQDFD